MKNLNEITPLSLKRKKQLRIVLSLLVILVAIRQFFMQDYENVFICMITLCLLGVPRVIDRTMGIDVPPLLEAIIMLFIFSAEILGEVNAFYEKIPMWDTMLHTINGFLMAAIGFSLVDIFNRSDRFLVKLSPLFVAIVAFCFSMTVGVLWEFFEFSVDQFLHMDMQKDFWITTIHSVAINPTGANVPIHMPINSLVVNGEDWIAKYGGYLDIGLIDTMKDLFVNFIGAVVFSIIGYGYVRHRGKGNLARKLIPTVKRIDLLDDFGNPVSPSDAMHEDVQVHLACKELEDSTIFQKLKKR